jgi:hypothetical protein
LLKFWRDFGRAGSCAGKMGCAPSTAPSKQVQILEGARKERQTHGAREPPRTGAPRASSRVAPEERSSSQEERFEALQKRAALEKQSASEGPRKAEPGKIPGSGNPAERLAAFQERKKQAALEKRDSSGEARSTMGQRGRLETSQAGVDELSKWRLRQAEIQKVNANYMKNTVSERQAASAVGRSKTVIEQRAPPGVFRSNTVQATTSPRRDRRPRTEQPDIDEVLQRMGLSGAQGMFSSGAQGGRNATALPVTHIRGARGGFSLTQAGWQCADGCC